MADNPIAGAGGIADGAAKDKAGSAADSEAATVGKVSEEGASSAGKGSTVGSDGKGPQADGTGSSSTSVSEESSSAAGAPGKGGTMAPPAPPAPAAPLGAGGTSDAAKAPGEQDGVVPGAGKGLAKNAGAAAAVPAAGAAGQLIVLMTFINWLKGLLMQMAAIAMNFWNLFMAAVLGAAKAVVGFFMGIGSAISGAVGGVVSAAVAGASSFFGAAVVAVMLVTSAVVGLNATDNAAQRDGGLITCEASATTALSEVEGEEGNADQITLANAKTIYSVFKAWGMPDENIAGIIGNWQAESGIDPTRVQNVANTPHKVSDEEQAGAENTDNGIGLGQWTFGRNTNLREYADGQGKSWGELTIQLGFLLSAKEGSDADIVKGMISESKGTPGEAALYFHDKWERSADTASMKERRVTYAEEWMGKFSGWTADKELADSILAQAGATVTGANSDRANTIRQDCKNAGSGSFALKDGGLSLEEAQKLMDLYLDEGEDFLQARYPNGAGGPGVCSGGISDNCVGFSTYFVNRYTSFQQYARGNGIDTASSMASMMGKETSKTPTVYSVVSGPGSSPAGHTFVVLGIQGDQAVIGEASCGTNHKGTRARLMPISQLTDGSWTFVDVTDLITQEPAS